MFRRVFVAAGKTLLRRFCSRCTAAGWPSSPAGATMLRRFYSQTAAARSPSRPAGGTLFHRFHSQTTAVGSPWRPAEATMVRRFCSKAAMAGSLSRPAGASIIRQFCSQAAVVGLRRFCSPAAFGSLSRPAGARLMQLHILSEECWHVAATAGHRFGFFRRHAIPMAIAAFGVGLWCMKKNTDLAKRNAEIAERNAELAERASRPSKIDWVEAGAVSRVVRNQKSCGSCWAMAVVASVEAVHYLKTLQLITLSVQELVDCNIENDGCEGGHYSYAFRYVRKNGLLAKSSYPYMARKSRCRKLDKKAVARISGYQFIRPTEDDLEKAVAKCPVIVTVQDHHLQSYKGGIMDHKFDSRLTGWHAVLVVGYGTDSYGVKYWRIKNSWGGNWGEGGFARLRRHIDDKRGVLGMFVSAPVYPLLTT